MERVKVLLADHGAHEWLFRTRMTEYNMHHGTCTLDSGGNWATRMPVETQVLSDCPAPNLTESNFTDNMPVRDTSLQAVLSLEAKIEASVR